MISPKSASPFTSPARISALEETALSFHNQGDLDEAAARYQDIISQAPDNAKSRYLLASIHCGRSQFDQAIGLLQQAIAINPHNASHYLLLGSCFFKKGDPNNALIQLEKGWRLLFPQPNTDLSIPLILARNVILGPMDYIVNFYPYYVEYGILLKNNNYYLQHPQIFSQTQKFINALDFSDPRADDRVCTLLGLFCFDKDSPIELNELSLNSIFLPIISWALIKNAISVALRLEAVIYERFIKQVETEQHFSKWIPIVSAPFQLKGMQQRQPTHHIQINQHPIPVAFFFHAGNFLAHTKVVLDLVSGWTKLKQANFIPKIFIFFEANRKCQDKFNNLGVETYFLDDYCANTSDLESEKLTVFKKLLKEQNIPICVWVSLPTVMPLAFSQRVAPVQIWWAMKYHNYYLADIDGYFTNGSLQRHRIIHQRQWQVIHSALQFSDHEEKRSAAKKIRDHFPENTIILGAMGREEKLCSIHYLEAVCHILRARPNAVYLWSGREKPSQVIEHFKQSGVGDRCYYIGWVDTAIYAKVFDIYLDSFPFGGGHTVFQSMWDEKAVVMRVSKENMETGVPMHMLPNENADENNAQLAQDIKALYIDDNGENLLYCTYCDEEYINTTLKLIDQPKLRAATGQANRAFVEKYMMDTKQMAESFSIQLTELIQELEQLKKITH